MKKTFRLNSFFKHRNVPTVQSVVDIDELIVHLDATSTTSYSGSGTTWTNLSRNAWSQVAGNASLMNGVSFLPSSPKCFNFDANDDYVGITETGNLFNFCPGISGFNELTIEAWIKTTGTLTADAHWCGKPYNEVGEYNYSIRHNNIYSNTDRNNPKSLNFTSIDTKNWEHIAIVFTPTQWGVYRNGVVDVPLTNHGITANSPTSGNMFKPLTLMNLYPYNWPSNGWNSLGDPYGFLGKLAQFRLYRKALTAEQVAQNYSATKDKFFPQDIPTEGLIVNLNAANASSYPGSGNVVTDLSGNNNHATLHRGVGYTTEKGGALIFDGNDDYAAINVDSWIRTRSSTYTFNTYFHYNESGYYGGGHVFCVTPLSGYNSPNGVTAGFWAHSHFRLPIFTSNGNQYLWRTIDSVSGVRDGTIIAPSPFVGGNKYMLTVVVSTNLLKFYVNGNLISTVNTLFNWSNLRTDHPVNIILGYGSPVDSGYPQNCRIYNFQAYDRELTAQEITSLYNFNTTL